MINNGNLEVLDMLTRIEQVADDAMKCSDQFSNPLATAIAATLHSLLGAIASKDFEDLDALMRHLNAFVAEVYRPDSEYDE